MMNIINIVVVSVIIIIFNFCFLACIMDVCGNGLLRLYVRGSHCFVFLHYGCLWWWLACLFKMHIYSF